MAFVKELTAEQLNAIWSDAPKVHNSFLPESHYRCDVNTGIIVRKEAYGDTKGSGGWGLEFIDPDGKDAFGNWRLASFGAR